MKTSFSIALTTLAAAFFMTAQAAPIQLEARSSTSGSATYYNTGLGSCGETNDDKELVVALSQSLMGGPNSPLCGKSITVHGPAGTSVTVKVVDSCPGCSKNAIDLSPAAFKKLSPLAVGNIPITWSL